MELKDKKTKITFHAGILTIGGTIIEIAYEVAENNQLKLKVNFGKYYGNDNKKEAKDMIKHGN